MLGRLLHLGSGSQATDPAQPSNTTSRPILSLESVQEDIHTRNLLFPDAQTLYHHRNDQFFPLSTAPATPSASTANTFDYSDHVELDVRDVRVIIMQDALGPTNASLLFDSHPLPTPPASSARQDLKTTPLSPRKGSHSQLSRPLSMFPDSPQPRHGAFDRRASVHSRTHSNAETDGQRAAREYREELATFSSCIFGNSELMAYKGTSTKVHVVPCEPRVTDHASSVVGDGRSSIGRSSGRSSKLSQSYSSQTMSPTYPGTLPTASATPRPSDRKKVLITRLFPVTLAADDLESDVTPQSRYSDDNGGFPFPPTGDEPTPRKKKPQPKQRRTPMYAVVLVVQLPPSPSRMPSAVPPKPGFCEPGSYNDQELFSSSYSSTRMSGWNLSGSGIGADTTDSSFSIDVEDRIDSLTQHWDIIMRTLTYLQSIVTTTIHTMLKQADIASPGPYSTSTVPHFVSPSWTERRGEGPRAKPPKSTTKLVCLWPNCLADDASIASEVGLARTRIVMGLSAARVVTGQGRWGIWRDEAIWTCKWATAMDQGPFFYNLLTGFLATHTDWLQALCTAAYRRRAILQQQNRNEDDLSLPARTIIVSDDKMASRRIIFLLSAFLPTNQHLPGLRAHRPSTSASVAAFSNSPPTYVVPVLREESLRRKINRRTGPRRASHSRAASQSTRTSAVPTQLAHLSMDHSHHRRASDAASIRTASLPILGNDLVSRKSTAATSTTTMPDSTTPHFTTGHRTDGQRRPRPGSSSSMAADDLKRSLKRGESNGSVNNRPTSQGLKWGSIMSGLWSSRRRESMDGGSAYGQAGDLRSPVKMGFSRCDKLSEMVREVSLAEEGGEEDTTNLHQTSDARDVRTPRENADRGRRFFTQLDRTPDPTGAYESPVKTSINADDGVIDVDVPFPDYMTSFESAISSPSSSGYLSTPGLPGLESFEQSGRITIDGDLPLNAAGWLNRFHPDFALQATPPQDGLLDKIKTALRAEPTPAPTQPMGNDLSERWIDVSSAIIADTTTSSVTRITYRRLVKPRATLDRSAIGGGGTVLTPSVLPYETQLDEEWIEELVTSPDEGLAEALDKVVNFYSDVSKDSSSASSQVQSEARGSSDGDVTIPDALSEVTQMVGPPLDIPRVQCKAVVLSALEETIRDVIDRRDEEAEDDGLQGKKGRGSQSVLRDAVRQWASNLDSGE